MGMLAPSASALYARSADSSASCGQQAMGGARVWLKGVVSCTTPSVPPAPVLALVPHAAVAAAKLGVAHPMRAYTAGGSPDTRTVVTRACAPSRSLSACTG